MKGVLLLLTILFFIFTGILLFLYLYTQQNIEISQPSTILTTSTASIMKLKSPVFEDGGTIPELYTCDGSNINPPLTFENIPQDTQSLALIVHDPDVPVDIRSDQNWDHWLIYNIPPSIQNVPENATLVASFGLNTYGTTSYSGPCPPKQYEPKKHRYVFTLYALDTTFELQTGADRKTIEAAFVGHVLDISLLTGMYERP